MASSGTTTFNLDISDVIAEAFERCGRDPSSLMDRHVLSARRSLNLMFQHWTTKGVHMWAIEQEQHTVTTGETSFTTPAGTIDVLDIVLRRQGVDTPVSRISREQYLNMPTKNDRGRPSIFYLDRQATPVVYYWQAAENDTDVLVYNRVRAVYDADAISENPDAPTVWQEAICAGLAAKLAVKWAPERLAVLVPLAKEAFDDADEMDRERADVVITPGHRRGRRGR